MWLAEGAANVIFRKEIAAADEPHAVRAQKIKEYRSELMGPYYAAERGLVDDVICMDRADLKSRHMIAGGVLVDDSFAERKECAAAGKVCVDLDAVPMLIEQLQMEER